MSNTLSTLKKALLGLALMLAGGIAVTTAVAQAIPYDGANTPNSPVPAFNVFTGVPSVGTESDFLRARVPTAASDTATAYVDPLNATCVPGQRIQMRVYVHNGASVAGNQNGSGPSVAHGTKVKVTVPGSEAKNFSPSATISASNASTVNDNVAIHCSNANNVKLTYLSGSASQYSIGSGVVALSDEIVNSGVPIRSRTVPGDVWGCWDDRVYVILSVQVEQKETPPPVVTNGICKALEVAFTNNKREVKATVTGEVNNAQIVGYKIDFGDGTVVNQQSATHTYANDDVVYKITSQVQVKLADGTTVWKDSASCNQQVKFLPDQPPVLIPPPVTTTTTTPPVTTTISSLPNTGPGAVVATFFGVSSFGTGMYYVLRRKLGL